MRRLNEPSHLDLRCLTFSLSTLHINVFPNDSLLKKKKKKKKKKTDDKCLLKFGAKRVKSKYGKPNVKDRYAFVRDFLKTLK